jgi:hypothetical protein
MCGQAARGGAVVGQAQAKRRRNLPLLGHATILSHRLAGNGRSRLCSVLSKRTGEKHMLQVYVSSVSDVYRYVASVLYECCKSRSGCCIC